MQADKPAVAPQGHLYRGVPEPFLAKKRPKRNIDKLIEAHTRQTVLRTSAVKSGRKHVIVPFEENEFQRPVLPVYVYILMFTVLIYQRSKSN